MSTAKAVGCEYCRYYGRVNCPLHRDGAEPAERLSPELEELAQLGEPPARAEPGDQVAELRRVIGDQAREIAELRALASRSPLGLRLEARDVNGAGLAGYELSTERLPHLWKFSYGPHVADVVTIQVSALGPESPAPRGKVWETEWLPAGEQAPELRRARWWRFWDRPPVTDPDPDDDDPGRRWWPHRRL